MSQECERISGVVIEYDDYLGTIVDQNKTEYLLKKTEILEDSTVNVGDQVSFEPETTGNGESSEQIARFVKVLRNKGIEQEE